MNPPTTKRSASRNHVVSEDDTNAIFLSREERAFVQRDILILGILYNAAHRAVTHAVPNDKTSIRTAQIHLDALTYYLEQVTPCELPLFRQNGIKPCTLTTLFPTIYEIEVKTKELLRRLAQRSGN